MQVWEARILSLDFQSPRGLQTWSLGQYSSLWPLTHSDQLPGNFIFTVAVGWKVFFFFFFTPPPVFSIFFCSRWWWLWSGVTPGQHWARRGQWKLNCWLWKLPVQFKSELPGDNSHLCWKKSSLLPTIISNDEQKYWPWSSRNKSIRASSVQCNLCFWGVQFGRPQWCVLWKDDTVLLDSLRHGILPVQHRASGEADCLWDVSSPVLKCAPRLVICVMRNQPVHQLSATHFCGSCLLSWSIDVQERAWHVAWVCSVLHYSLHVNFLLPILKFIGKILDLSKIWGDPTAGGYLSL